MHFRGRSLPWRDQKLQSPTCQEEHLRLALERLFLGAGARGRTRVARVGRAARDALEDRKTTSPDRPEETLSGPSFETLSQQRRRRELLALILMWPLLLVAVMVLTYHCCPRTGDEQRSSRKMMLQKKDQ
ncbi:unnamed protein product [Durusdinium trenchii]